MDMSIILGVYLAGFFMTSGYGAGVCFNSDQRMVGPELCTVATTAGAVIWPITIPAAIIAEKQKK